MSRRLRVLQAIEAAIRDGPPTPPEGLTVHRDVHTPEEKDDLPSVVIYDAGGVAEQERGGNLTEYTDRVAVVIRCVGVRGTPPDDTLDPFWSHVRRAVLADQTLGGECGKITALPREAPTFLDADRIYVGIVQMFEVIYQTQRVNPEEDN